MARRLDGPDGRSGTAAGIRAPRFTAARSGQGRVNAADALAGSVEIAGERIGQLAAQDAQMKTQDAAKRAAEMKEEQARLRGVEVAQQAADFRVNWTKELATRSDGYNGQGDFSQTFELDVKADIESRLDGVTDPNTRAVLERSLTQAATQYRVDAQGFEIQTKRAAAFKGVGDTTERVTNQILTDPRQLQASLADLPVLAAAVPEALREKWMKESAENYGAAYVDGLNEKNPERLKSELESGTWDDLLSPSVKARAVSANAAELGRRESLTAQAEKDSAREKQRAALEAQRKAEKAAALQSAEAKEAMRDAGAVLSGGFDIGAENLDELRETAFATNDPDVIKAYGALADQRHILTTAREMTPAQLKTFIEGERTGGPMTKDRLDRMNAVEGVYSAMQDGLARDPLGWAAQTFDAPIAPLDLSAEDAAGQLQARRVVARQVADEYDQPLRIFRPDEVAELKADLDTGGDALVSRVTTLIDGLGPDTPAGLKELSKDAPLLSFLGGLTRGGRDTQVLKDTAAGLALMRTDGFVSRQPQARERNEVMREEIDTALTALPQTQGLVTEAAAAIYEQRAQQEGFYFNPDDAGSVSDAKDRYRRAVQEAIGARYVGKTQYGGTIEVNGRTTIAPAFVQADKLERVVEGLTDSQWSAAGDGFPVDVDGSPLSMKDLRRAQLQAIGDGQYLVALGDIDADNPRYAGTAADTDYVLDLNLIENQLRQGKLAKYLYGGQ